MVKVPTSKIYGCERCGNEWLQRITAVKDEDGLKIKKINAAARPKNCTNCKSIHWKN